MNDYSCGSTISVYFLGLSALFCLPGIPNYVYLGYFSLFIKILVKYFFIIHCTVHSVCTYLHILYICFIHTTYILCVNLSERFVSPDHFILMSKSLQQEYRLRKCSFIAISVSVNTVSVPGSTDIYISGHSARYSGIIQYIRNTVFALTTVRGYV